MTRQLLKASNLALNVQLSFLVDLEESLEPKLDLPQKKKQKNTPSPLPPYGEHSDFILPDFGFEPVDPYLHENPLVLKYGHLEYNPKLFNPQ